MSIKKFNVKINYTTPHTFEREVYANDEKSASEVAIAIFNDGMKNKIVEEDVKIETTEIS